MKLFNVITIKDDHNTFDLFNQLQIIGTKKTIKEAIELAGKTADDIIDDILQNVEEEIEEPIGDDTSEFFILEEYNNGMHLNIEDRGSGDYYNIIIKEFDI